MDFIKFYFECQKSKNANIRKIKKKKYLYYKKVTKLISLYRENISLSIHIILAFFNIFLRLVSLKNQNQKPLIHEYFFISG
jgi:hypothetical protein